MVKSQPTNVEIDDARSQRSLTETQRHEEKALLSLDRVNDSVPISAEPNSADLSG